jgi:hypothetical protein
VLDFVKITQTERDRADRLANSAAGAALESDVQGEARENGTKTFVPGEGRSAEESFVTNFTPEQKEQIRQMVANAKSPAEIEEIELSVKRGSFPSFAAPSPPLPPVDDETSEKKRPAEENGNGKAKKPKVLNGGD